MGSEDEAITIEHSTPKKVNVPEIEEELQTLASGYQVDAEARYACCRTLTLAICCDRSDVPESLDELVGQIVTRNPARAILLHVEPEATVEGLEAWVRTHGVRRGERERQTPAEQITLYARGDGVRELPRQVLRLRVANLPLVIWWRGQPNLDDHLLKDLLTAADRLILDSACFAVAPSRLASFVVQLHREFPHVSIGDLNWARLRPWRELVAQFFDAPTHQRYLEELSEIVIEYSANAGGNPNQAILLAMWLATLLNWKAVSSTRPHPGTDLWLNFWDSGRQIQVVIFGREGFGMPPGLLVSVALHVRHEPEATFQITQSHHDYATTRWKIGRKVTERSAALQIPDEAALVCSELDVTHRDRIYQHALVMLEQLSA